MPDDEYSHIACIVAADPDVRNHAIHMLNPGRSERERKQIMWYDCAAKILNDACDWLLACQEEAEACATEADRITVQQGLPDRMDRPLRLPVG